MTALIAGLLLAAIGAAVYGICQFSQGGLYVSETIPGRTARVRFIGVEVAHILVYQDGECVHHEVVPTMPPDRAVTLLQEWGFK